VLGSVDPVESEDGEGEWFEDEDLGDVGVVFGDGFDQGEEEVEGWEDGFDEFVGGRWGLFGWGCHCGWWNL